MDAPRPRGSGAPHGAIAVFVVSGVAGAVPLHGGIVAWLESAPALLSASDGLPVATAVFFVCFSGLVGIGSVAKRLAEAERSMSRGLMLALGVTIVTLGFVVLTLAEGPTTSSAASGAWPLLGLVAVVSAGLAVAAHDRFGASARLAQTMAADDSLPGRPQEGEAAPTASVAVVATVTAVLATVLFVDLAILVRVLGGLTLLVFGALNIALVVMRESEIQYYRPDFEAPLYPWIQIAGAMASALLIWELGWVAMASCAAITLVGLVGYFGYARARVQRAGAVYHVFARLGSRQSVGLDHELREILGEKGLHDDDPYDHLLEKATTLDLRHALDFAEVIRTGSRMLSRMANVDADELEEALLDELALGLMPIYNGMAVPHHLFTELDEPVMLIMRMRVGASVSFDEKRAHVRNRGRVFAAVFLLCPDSMMGGHLRMLSQLAARAEEPEFLARWLEAPGAAALKRLLSDGVSSDSGESHDDLLAVIDWDQVDDEAGELGDVSSEDLVETLPPSYVDRTDWLEPN
jgi:mannitol/fructose-specific phosphotransferase system IIA component (Ntr-type)